MTADNNSPKAMPAKLAVSVVIRRESRFLLVERANDPGRGMFAFPGGRVEQGEELLFAASRELMEETGLHATDLREIACYDLAGTGGGFELHVFSTDTFSGELAAGDDAMSADWYSFEQMRVMPVPQSVLEVASMLLEIDS